MVMTPAQEQPVPAPPGHLQRYWPPPSMVPSPGVLPATLAAGLVGAVALVVSRAGLGWLLTGLAVAAAALVSARRRPGLGEFDFFRLLQNKPVAALCAAPLASEQGTVGKPQQPAALRAGNIECSHSVVEPPPVEKEGQAHCMLRHRERDAK